MPCKYRFVGLFPFSNCKSQDDNTKTPRRIDFTAAPSGKSSQKLRQAPHHERSAHNPASSNDQSIACCDPDDSAIT
jgi:hypothetical protein